MSGPKVPLWADLSFLIHGLATCIVLSLWYECPGSEVMSNHVIQGQCTTGRTIKHAELRSYPMDCCTSLSVRWPDGMQLQLITASRIRKGQLLLTKKDALA